MSLRRIIYYIFMAFGLFTWINFLFWHLLEDCYPTIIGMPWYDAVLFGGTVILCFIAGVGAGAATLYAPIDIANKTKKGYRR